MPAQPVDEILCPACHAELPADALHCSACGAATLVSSPHTRPESQVHPEPAPRRAAAHSPAAHSPAARSPIARHQQSADGPPRSTSKPPLLDRPWVVLSLLFFVMAILGLPVLWKSRAFRPPMKVLLSILVTLYTALLVAGVAAICYWAYQSWMELLGS